tara:strand:- start:428 stop:724 length:297 start_codon:yes stop_codon:yes gene_type:complete
MRKITKESVQAFNNCMRFKKANMEVFYSKSQESTYMTLHGNTIAVKYKDKLTISTCGWQSNTTKERLNALDGVNIYQKNWVWYLNGSEWDGSLIEIKK